MVLGIQVPEGVGWSDIKSLLKDIFIFFASFMVVGMFWNNHRRLFEYVEKINEKFIWRNLLFLFVLAIIPIFTKWIAQHPEATIPVAGYGIVFLLATLAASFLFSGAVPLFNSEAKKVMKMRRSSSYLAVIMIFAGIVLIIVGAFFFPEVAAWMFIGYPILMAAVNVWVDRWDMEKQDEKRRKMRGIRKNG